MNTTKKDNLYLGRDEAPLSVEIVSAKGSYLYGPKGEKYIDFLMGWSVGTIGWGNKEIIRKIRNFDGPEYVLPNYVYKPWTELSEILAKITPGKLSKTFRATGGTEAVEIALQAAMSHTKRSKFISIEGSYHGHSLGTLSIGDSGFRKWYKNLLPNCHKIKPPLNKKTAQKVVNLIKRGDIAAFISEPIVLNASVTIPDNDFFQTIQAACKKYGTVFIMDEVATGFGRTGKLFASENYNLEPDIMCLGKGITGGYGALGATITTEEIAKSMEYEFSFYSTFGWNPLNVHAALSYLQYFLPRKETILKNTNEMSNYFKKRLQAMNMPHLTDLRIKGLAIGGVFSKAGYARELSNRCQKKGLLFSSYSFTVFPALTIDKKTADEGLSIIERSL